MKRNRISAEDVDLVERFVLEMSVIDIGQAVGHDVHGRRSRERDARDVFRYVQQYVVERCSVLRSQSEALQGGVARERSEIEII